MDLDRRRASMVLFELEKALGSLICQTSAGATFDQVGLDRVRARELARSGVNLSDAPIDELVKHCYLEELLQLAQQAVKGSAYEVGISRIRTLCVSLDIFEVRNACAHPLRDFPRQYWYKVATVVSDHSLNQVGLESPLVALAAAEMNTLSDPPAEWLARFDWELPSNLPDRIEHEVTGLIGRKEVQRKLLDILHNPRNAAAAVVARGGVGKTALVLEALRTIVCDPKEAEIFDCVVYVSLKSESLTAQGIKRTAAAKSLEELEVAIASAINEIKGEANEGIDAVFEAHQEGKILLCLDNLESLLRDQPDLFSLINDRLPPSWRLLITSRVRIDGALTLPIDDLQRTDAIALAHKYSRTKGLPLPGDLAPQIAELARNNPLALKLTVDLMSMGNDLHSAAEIATAEIVQFAYDRLIDALSEIAIKALEVVFVYDGCSRADIVGVLEADSDSVAEAVAELTNTSLVSRDLSEFEERFHLNESVRDFLRVNTRNLKFRGEIEASLKRAREIQASYHAEQARRGVNIHAVEYVPPGIPVQLSELAFAVNRVSKKSQRNDSKQIGKLLEKFRTFESEFSNSEIYWRFYGKLMSFVDTGSAVSLLTRAREIDEVKPQARALQAWLFIKIGRAADAFPVFDSLDAEGWCLESQAGESFSVYVRTGLLRSLVFTEQFEAVIERTRDWESSGHLMLSEGLARLSSFRQHEVGAADRAVAFKECLRILERLVRSHGYTRELCGQAIKLFKDIAHWILFRDLQSDAAASAIDSMAKHLPSMTALISRNDIVALDLDALAESPHVSVDLAGKITRLRQRLLGIPILQQTVLAKKGYVVLEVSAPPKSQGDDLGRYLFAKDRDGRDYYVSIDALKNGGWVEWSRILKGEQIIAKPNESAKPGKSLSVSEAFLASSKIER